MMEFREPAAQNCTSTQLQNRGADRGPQPGSPAGVVVATGSVSVSLKRFENPSYFAVEWSRDLDPVATAPRFCG